MHHINVFFIYFEDRGSRYLRNVSLFLKSHCRKLYPKLLRRLLFKSTADVTKVLHASFPPVVYFALSDISLFSYRILLMFWMPVRYLSVYVNCFAIDSWNCLVFPFLFPSGLSMFHETYARLSCSFIKIIQLQTSVSLILKVHRAWTENNTRTDGGWRN